MPFDEKRAQLADALFECGAVKFGAFPLKIHEENPDAPLSPIYFELRTEHHPTNPGPLTREFIGMCGPILMERAGEFNAITGLPNAGEPFCSAVAWAMARQYRIVNRIELRKTTNPDGTRQIDSIIRDGSPDGALVAVFDDLITGAHTKREAISVLENAGKVVACLVVLIDRMQGGRQDLEADGYKVRSVFTIYELLNHYVATDKLTENKAQEVREYICNQ